MSNETPTPERHMQKRSMRICGHRTSIALEPNFWAHFETMAKAQRVSIPVLAAQIGKNLPEGQSLASAIRCAALNDALALAKAHAR